MCTYLLCFMSLSFFSKMTRMENWPVINHKVTLHKQMYEQIDDQILLNFCITWNEEYEDTGCIWFSSTNWPLNYKTNIRIYIHIVISNIQISSLHKMLFLDNYIIGRLCLKIIGYILLRLWELETALIFNSCLNWHSVSSFCGFLYWISAVQHRNCFGGVKVV